VVPNTMLRLAFSATLLTLTIITSGCAKDGTRSATPSRGKTGSVIFIHPDGASSATWGAARALHVGPDANLQWDLLPHIALYRGHMADSLTGTSNGGATVHAYGIKVDEDAFGRTAGGSRGRDITNERGERTSVALEAMRAGIPVGLVQTGIAPEPGTACFVVSNETRKNYNEIAASLVESGAHVMLSGGEQYFIPEGTRGVYGPGARKDGRDLLEEARKRGYVVVRTKAELRALPSSATRVLGLFASSHTFNDRPEEELRSLGLPLYEVDAPTVGEMTEVAITVLQRTSDQFLLVVEEEGTDNFGNNNNASGVLEAARRADEAFGIARTHIAKHPQTLVITAADSDGGGMRLVGLSPKDGEKAAKGLPKVGSNGAPIDGIDGAGTAPFIAAPDATGRRLPFYITWAAEEDVSGGILVRADGLNAEQVRGSMDNTHIAKLIRYTLFGTTPPLH
jgi:alkaline phosphatase